MPVPFSKEFHIKPEVLKDTGVFDVLLDMDTRVFIDPALLELCNEPEFAGAHEKVERYFSGIITLLKHSKRKNDMYWHQADRFLTFREISGSCLGYAKDGTAGNAIGSRLRHGILETIRDLIHEGETDPALFELLGVFQEGIGCDRISDLITFILRENIVQYTQRVVLKCQIPTIMMLCAGKEYQTCRNPYNKKPLLLLPSVILNPLPIADSFNDIDMVCMENQRIRDEINSYFDFNKRQKLLKSEIYKLMYASPRFRRAIITAYKTTPKIAYDFSSDPSGEYVWYGIAQEVAEKFPLDFENTSITSIEDVLSVVEKICAQFKSLIEDNGLSTLLFDTTGKPKHESAAQLLFFGVADAYCEANNIDLARESNNGRGPVDFKLSRGWSDKVVVEVKLTSNSQLKHGIEIQLPIYMKQERTKKAIYLIIENGHKQALNNFIEYYDSLSVPEKGKIPYIVVDATSKLSASKA